ncbi:hypothetical protein FH972_022465 [Carpinus fangiana]|uniref:Kinesin motor domain-containing protein n=1 Tax=Carpinus fangiana TaxID=176857 RepID=A0A5N6KSC4_9ROSI|nr:hypothetical protein FH972_022465 [Carpinus fangiana]
MASVRPGSRASARPRSASYLSDDADLKTAVKVAVRVRPPLDPSDPSLDLIPARFRGLTCNVTNQTTLTIDSNQGKKLFVFDRVFGDSETQQGIWEYISDSVNSFCQGYNVSILAYGQSGAGKSYTMGTSNPGEQTNASAQGIIPRAAAALFDKLHSENGTHARGPSTGGIRPPSRYSTSGMPVQNKLTDGDKNWQLKATYVEIYNEQLRDLLVPESVPANERGTVAIREDAKGRIILTGLQQVAINSIEDLLNALTFGSSIRQTDATAINSKSSRSHAVFSLNLVQKKNRASKGGPNYTGAAHAMNGNEHWVTMDSKLHFVDLAGSERLKNSGLTGERVKEGISINAGLASLGKVISQLSTKNAGGHVSYRDSRLTRLLQDSLGGNAITYMVACVNPVEFHLSETLNTVQYAQRARNIQSRPQVQQRAEDGDKQLVIDRLRSEVAFLREQIRLSERTERRNNSHQERNNRYASRETELQNQLLDSQENYSALSQRHAKLVSELAKSKDVDVDMPALKSALANIASERLDRSNNFSEAVEQVVLEYEKTIQSLESSLSNTRSLLSTSESNLLEREAKIVYLEAVAQQLQARIQKAMEREADSESYLRDLEAKLEGISSGEEKYHVVIADLRKELQRIRESESSAEEYISTLEERLAEAEQDADIMQREIKRLEHVVERQRGIGKMDGLHQELDVLRQDDVTAQNGHAKSGPADKSSDTDMFHDRLIGTTTASHPNGEVHPDSAEAEWKSFGPMDGDLESNISRSEYGDANETQALSTKPSTQHLTPGSKRDPNVQSPAQSRAIADKLETVTMELFDLRVDHENTVNELDDVSRKYEIALSTLAELQDAVDEARSPRPMSFLERNNINGHSAEHYRLSSRMLSSELSSLGRPPTLIDASTTSGADSTDSAASVPLKDTESLADSVRKLKRANAEKDINMAELTENYSQLQAQHENALNYIEELKEEAQKALQVKRASIMPMSSRRGMSVISTTKADDRHLNALRTIAAESFDGHPDAMKSFEQSLTAAITISQERSDRVAQLEAELISTKKEMDVKNTMISGLSRERSSRPTAAAMDMSLIAQLREHLSASQKQIQELHENSTNGNRDLHSGLQSIKATLTTGHKATLSADSATGQDVPGGFPADSVAGSEVVNNTDNLAFHKELSAWEEEHDNRMSSLLASEQQLLVTITGLEASLRNAENLHAERGAAAALRASMSANSQDIEAEKARHVETVTALQKEIDGYKATAEGHATKLSLLESSYAQIIKEVEEDQKSRELTEVELRTHRDLVNNLEHQIEQQKSLAMFHQQGLSSLQESHAKELEEFKLTTAAQHQQKLEEELSKHKEATTQLQAELEKAQVEMASLMQNVSSAVDDEPDTRDLHSRIKSITDEHQNLTSKHSSAVNALVEAQKQTENSKRVTADLQSKVTELTMINEETLKELERSGEKEKKSSRLVQELETQLTQIFDQHKSTTTKLTSTQTEKAEADKQLSEFRSKVADLEKQLAEAKRTTVYAGSLHSQRDSLGPQDASLRKSNSHQSLPSPPPAVPLPPLPSLNGQTPPSPVTGKGASDFSSPPGSRHTSRDLHASQQAQQQQFQQQFQQQLDDQEVKIKQMEKHLAAEKQLTSTLEEALVDLETQTNRTRQEMEAWKKKCREVEEEASGLRRERGTMRNSIQAVEEERDRRIRAEQARRQLEERMEALGKKTKKKSGGLNCF